VQRKSKSRLSEGGFFVWFGIRFFFAWPTFWFLKSYGDYVGASFHARLGFHGCSPFVDFVTALVLRFVLPYLLRPAPFGSARTTTGRVPAFRSFWFRGFLPFASLLGYGQVSSLDIRLGSHGCSPYL
jgi:hypothetical protein